VRPAPTTLLAGGGSRARALISIMYLIFGEGYEELTDPRIAQFAGISTEAFHKHFASKEAAFLALVDAIEGEALDRVGERIGGAGWPESVNRGVGAFVDYLVSREPLTRVAFAELFSVGPGIVDRLTRLADELTHLLTNNAPRPSRAPLIAREATAGALWGIVSSRALANRVAGLGQVREQLSFLVLAPHIGAEAAVKAIEATRSPPAPA